MNRFIFSSIICFNIFSTVLSTKAIVLFLEKNNIKSVANERSSHFHSCRQWRWIWFPFITITSLLFFWSIKSLEVNNVNYFLLASSAIGITGYLDDILDTSTPPFCYTNISITSCDTFFSKFPKNISFNLVSLINIYYYFLAYFS